MSVSFNRQIAFGLRWWRNWRKTGSWQTRRALRPWPQALEGRALLSTILEYPIPGNSTTSGSVINQITPGPNGNVWFTNGLLNNTIDEVAPGGQITQFPMTTTPSAPDSDSADGIT